MKGLDAQLAEITKAAFATLADVKAEGCRPARRGAADHRVPARQRRGREGHRGRGHAADVAGARRPGIFEALAQSKAKGVGVAVVGKLKDLPPDGAARRAAARAGAHRLREGLPRCRREGHAPLRHARARPAHAPWRSHPDKELAERAKKLLALGGGLPNADRQKVIEEFKHILGEDRRRGGGQEGVRDALREVPQALRRGHADRPRPHRLRGAPEGRDC